MFIKTTKSQNYTYVQLVESYRDNDKIKHKVILNLGRLDLLIESGIAKKLANSLLRITGSESITPDLIKETSRLTYGHMVYERIWNQINLQDIFTRFLKKTKIEFDLISTVYYLTVNRLLNASSKKKAFEIKNNYLGIDTTIELQHIYRSLDFLALNKEQIETALYEKQKDLFHMELDVVFYDVTTFHFESQDADDLRDFGFSKANKINEVQVVMGLLVNNEGRPIGYELFEGNTFEGATFVKALDVLSKRFRLKKVIIVADKAMHSNGNLHLVRQAGYDYIVSSRLKNASAKQKERALNKQDFINVIDKETGEIIYGYKELPNSFVFVDEKTKQKHKYQDRLMVSWCAARSLNDQKKRDRLWQRAEKTIAKGKKSPNTPKGAARYLKMGNKSVITGLDQEKYDMDARWDGYYAVQYSGEGLNHQQVMEQYHQLWRIEESFRILKTTMNTRPIFHWTPARIKGHFMLCFIAFMLERTMEIKLKANKISLSPAKIKEALNSLQVSQLDINGETYYLKSSRNAEANKILRAMKIPSLKNITPASEFTSG